MIPEYVAYLAAQRRAEFVARCARPNAPVLLEDQPQASRERFAGIRARLGADLRRLADRLDPAPRRLTPTSAHRR